MIEYETRLYHCHKIQKNVKIAEDYDSSTDGRRLVRCSCPYHQYKDMRPHCDGYNEFGFQCCYAKS